MLPIFWKGILAISFSLNFNSNHLESYYYQFLGNSIFLPKNPKYSQIYNSLKHHDQIVLFMKTMISHESTLKAALKYIYQISKANLLWTEDERFLSDSERNVWQLINAITVYYRLSIWTWQALAELQIIKQTKSIHQSNGIIRNINSGF